MKKVLAKLFIFGMVTGLSISAHTVAKEANTCYICECGGGGCSCTKIPCNITR